MEIDTTTLERAKALLAPLPAMDLAVQRTVALTEGAIQAQERLQIEPYLKPTLSDLLTIAKYAQMIAGLEARERRDASALVWARLALEFWDDAVDQSLTGFAVLDLLGKPQKA